MEEEGQQWEKGVQWKGRRNVLDTGVRKDNYAVQQTPCVSMDVQHNNRATLLNGAPFRGMHVCTPISDSVQCVVFISSDVCLFV